MRNSFIVSVPYSSVPSLIKQLEKEGEFKKAEAVRERYKTMKPDERVRVILYG